MLFLRSLNRSSFFFSVAKVESLLKKWMLAQEAIYMKMETYLASVWGEHLKSLNDSLLLIGLKNILRRYGRLLFN